MELLKLESLKSYYQEKYNKAKHFIDSYKNFDELYKQCKQFVDEHNTNTNNKEEAIKREIADKVLPDHLIDELEQDQFLSLFAENSLLKVAYNALTESFCAYKGSVDMTLNSMNDTIGACASVHVKGESKRMWGRNDHLYEADGVITWNTSSGHEVVFYIEGKDNGQGPPEVAKVKAKKDDSECLIPNIEEVCKANNISFEYY